ncbi:MAG: oligosaccharide flippase family protein [Acidimicrobiales bacterium]|nr:oligosaccharide flippase family protein [Acidimicrobiales bacterium]
MSDATVQRLRLRGLVQSRGVDQAVLGVASLLLARRLGPDVFAPIAVLFVLNSLAIQVADFGVGFRVLRAAPGEHLAAASLRRLRWVNAAVGVGGVVVGLVLVPVAGAAIGATVAGGGVLWACAGESYVRKAATLKVVGDRPVVRAELVGAVWFAAACTAGALAGAGVVAFAAAFVLKHGIEIAMTGAGLELFTADGAPTRASDEWFGQVVTYAAANVDFLLVGALLGPVALSQYVIAFRMASAAPALLAVPFTQAAFVDLASTADDTDQAQGHLDRLVQRGWMLGLAGAAIAVVLAVVLPWFLGPDWAPVGPVLVVLAFAVPWRMLLGIAVGTALTADGARNVVRWESIRLVLLGLVVAIAASLSGVVAVAAATATFGVVAIGIELQRAAALRGLRVGRTLPVLSAIAIVGSLATAIVLGRA